MSIILIIEDNILLRKTLEQILKTDEHSILQASDGRVGIAMARAARPDLILLDLMMPSMSGEQVARYLLADPSLCSIPIIVLTAMNQPDLVLDLLALRNVHDYLLKPISPDRLLQRTQAVLDGKGGRPCRHSEDG